MNTTLQLEETIQHIYDAPKLLVEWTPRWEDFVTSIRPAMARSGRRLAGEAAHGLPPYREMLVTLLAEAFLIFAVIILPFEIAKLRPYVPPQPQSHDVIYYSGDELPRTEDLGGAEAGTSGRAGGREAHHRTQTIKIARGGSLVERVVDAPNLKLPASRDAVANLLSVTPNLGPPPSEGLHSSRAIPNVTANVVAPAPNMTRDYTRNSPSAVESVVPPAPNVSRERPLSAPDLNASVISPAPSVSRDHALVAPLLAPSVVAPAPNLSRERSRFAPSVTAGIVPPAPGGVSRDVSRSAVQMTEAAVIPPPVSSPERASIRDPKLTLPSASVVAPPPSANVSPDMRRMASGSVADPSRSVVPPPPQTGSGSLVSSLIGKIFGTTDVVPPPPAISGTSSSGSPNGLRAGSGNASGNAVVPPPPSISGSGSGASRALGGANGQSGGNGVVPPPPSVSGSGRGSGNSTPGGTLLAGNVVPPPPSVGGGTASIGSGRGSKGTGFGGSMDTGSVLAPPAGGGSGNGSGAVISTQPGTKVGSPGNNGGALAMSPSGGDQPGLGGAGGGEGIGHGNGTGSGMTGEGTGAGKTGSGRGSDPSARGGISPTNGPGGAGNASSGNPPVPGVSVSGGSTMVTLPSFGSDGGGNGDPNLPGRTQIKEQQGPAITIVATSRSGGAFNFYGKLPGDNYTVYVDTSAGTVVMQFADPASTSHSNAGTITGPQAIRANLPSDLPHARLVVSCVLDASGNLKNLRVLEPGPATMTANVMAALPSWKFRPAMRGKQPVEVNALLGFGVDTNDR
ncbi:MAG TPA: energy transducer TonB [Candidatus Sulfotelmatobacter sp.]